MPYFIANPFKVLVSAVRGVLNMGSELEHRLEWLLFHSPVGTQFHCPAGSQLALCIVMAYLSFL